MLFVTALSRRAEDSISMQSRLRSTPTPLRKEPYGVTTARRQSRCNRRHQRGRFRCNATPLIKDKHNYQAITQPISKVCRLHVEGSWKTSSGNEPTTTTTSRSCSIWIHACTDFCHDQQCSKRRLGWLITQLIGLWGYLQLAISNHHRIENLDVIELQEIDI